MNNDLISRAALIFEIQHGNHPKFYDGQHVADWQMSCIRNAPAVDAEPARRGEWTELYKNDIWDCYACSLCGYMCDSKSRFCPNCGVKMDGGTQDA